MKLEIIVDKSIELAIERVVENEIGNVPIHITRKQKSIYEIDIDAEMTNEQKVNIRDEIVNIFETKGLIVSFKVL